MKRDTLFIEHILEAIRRVRVYTVVNHLPPLEIALQELLPGE